MSKNLQNSKNTPYIKEKSLVEEKQARAFGDVVRKIRQSKAISQETLAALAHVNRVHMGAIERGEHMPTLGIIFRIALALDIRVGSLLSQVEEELEKG